MWGVFFFCVAFVGQHQCDESAITLAAPTQPQEETRPTARAITKELRARVRQVLWRLPWENNWKEVWWRLLQHGMVRGSRGPRMAHEAGDSLPLWLATLSRIATCCTGATTTVAHLLDLHRIFSHQASHTTQPPRFRAAAATACVAARAVMPNCEEGSVVCCVPSCPDGHVKS
jgi:hypothetical protein